jgi:hypothetical protein
MKARQQIELMNKIIRELEDLRNSQTSVLKKISQIEADNINLGSDLLNDGLPAIHEEVDDAVSKINSLIEPFTEYKNEFEKANPVSEEE